MTQKELVKATAAAVNDAYKAEGKKTISEGTVDDVFKAGIKIASDKLTSGDKIQLNGFGSFEVTKRAAREGHNPATGQKIKIPAKNVVKFKAAKALKDSIN
jgi:DNA-binding protein HU-beta